jgi:mycothiol synthase
MITIRPYREADLPTLVRLINEADAVDRLERGTSLEEQRENFGLPDYHPEENVFVAQDDKGRMVGYGSLYLERGEAESICSTNGVVHPYWRRQGIGRRLLERLWEQARERKGEIKSGMVYFDGEALSSERGQIALFEGFEMRVVRHFVIMIYQPLDQIAEPRFPPGIAVRTWRRGEDDEAVLEVFNEAFADHWGFVPVRRENWLYWIGSSQIRPELALLAMSGDEIAGFCLCHIDEERISRLGRKEGYVNSLAVRRPYRRRGLGRALLLAGLHLLKEEGMESATLDVDAASLIDATRLYEGVGFREQKRYILYRREM